MISGVRLYAAGSLRAALTEAGRAFEQKSGVPVAGTFGASGLLRQRLEKGEAADVFASANMEHPRALEKEGKAGPVRLFARNKLCALAAPHVRVDTASLLERLLDPSIKVGTSTPKADPSGDYAFELFAKAEAVRPGSRAVLEAKALKLVGGPDSAQAPQGRNIYGFLVSEGRADIFLGYCTGAAEARQEVPALRSVAVPQALSVGADYGLALLKGAKPEAAQFAQFILSPEGQAILVRHGFDPGDRP